MIIAIDGPAASGKSTIAREVAKKLSHKHIGTGAMYRAVTYRSLKSKTDIYDEENLARIVRNYPVEFVEKGANKEERVFIDNEDVTDYLFTPKVDSSVSFVAKNSKVRKELVKQQRRLAKQGNVVMEGRDIGTVVLPEADVKIFLTASSEERASRRKKELESKGHICNKEELKRELVYRDKIDSTRKDSPLAKATGACAVDTTGKSIKEVVDMVLDVIRKKNR